MPPLRPNGEYVAAHPGVVDLLVQFGQQLVQVGGIVAACFGRVVHHLGVGAFLDPPQLSVGRVVRLDHWLALEVPALPALRGTQILGPFGARWADAREGVPAGHQHRLCLPRGQVGAPQLDRPDTGPVVDG
jgi:hypothetical protein